MTAVSEQVKRWLFLAVLAAAVLAAAVWYAVGPPAALMPGRSRGGDIVPPDVASSIDSLLGPQSLPRAIVIPMASLSASTMPGLKDSLLSISRSNRVLHIDVDSTWIEGRIVWVSDEAFALGDYVGGRIEREADGRERYVLLPGWEPPGGSAQ